MQRPQAGDMPGGWPAQNHPESPHEYEYGYHQADGYGHPTAPGHPHYDTHPGSLNEQHGSHPEAHHDHHGGHQWHHDSVPPSQQGHHFGVHLDPKDGPVDPGSHGPEHASVPGDPPNIDARILSNTPQPIGVDNAGGIRDSNSPPDMSAVHHHHYHTIPKKKMSKAGKSQAKSQINIGNAQQPAQQGAGGGGGGGGGDNFSMMMMQQMMMQQMQSQQMQAQQMQAAQMAALTQAQMQRLSTGGGIATGQQGKNARAPPATKVNIKTKKRKGKTKPATKVRAVAVPAVVEPVQRQQSLSAAAPSALDNWQEATIILCIAIISLIYLVSTRAADNKDGKEERKPSVAAKYMT